MLQTNESARIKVIYNKSYMYINFNGKLNSPVLTMFDVVIGFSPVNDLWYSIRLIKAQGDAENEKGQEK